MKFHHLNFATLLFRFYLMMAAVIIGFFAGIPWLAFLALPIFMSALMGIEFKKGTAFMRKSKETRANVSAHPQTTH
jgi:hypothetical protein